MFSNEEAMSKVASGPIIPASSVWDAIQEGHRVYALLADHSALVRIISPEFAAYDYAGFFIGASTIPIRNA